jgi:hypothetical protein
MKVFSFPFIAKVHLFSAAFIMPIALLFLSTGFLITLADINGGYDETVYQVSLSQPLVRDEPTLKKLVLAEMERLQLAKPDGWTGVDDLDEDPWYRFQQSDGVGRIILLEPTANPLVAKMTVKDASLYRKFVLLHNAHGNKYFKIYSLIFVLTLSSMLVTGYLMAWRLKHHRRPMIIASTGSVLLFLLLLVIQ